MCTSCQRNNSRTRCPRQSLLSILGRALPAVLFAGLSVRTDVRWSPWRLAYQAILMAFSPQPSLQRRFREARRQLAWLWPKQRRLGRGYNGFKKALLQHSPAMLQRVLPYLRQKVQAVAGDYWLLANFCVFIVDGSQFDCPRSKANHKAFGHRGKDKHRPSLYLTTIWHAGTGLPYAWRIDKAAASERQHLLEMLDLLPAGALLVLDAGFVGYEVLATIQASGRQFLIRVGSGTHLLEGLKGGRAVRGRVHLWPANHRQSPPLALRLIAVGSRTKRIHLLTNVLDPCRLSRQQAGQFYRGRWAAELQFRTLKQTLARRKMLARSPKMAQAELAWTLVGLWLLELLGGQIRLQKRCDPLRLSMAQVLDVLREALGGTLRANLPQALATAVLDEYHRRRPKASRHWPNKKKDPRPGAPKLRPATAAEIQRAQEPHQQRCAA